MDLQIDSVIVFQLLQGLWWSIVLMYVSYISLITFFPCGLRLCMVYEGYTRFIEPAPVIMLKGSSTVRRGVLGLSVAGGWYG